MSPLIEDNLEAIGRLCRLYGVRKLELFGSILRQDFDPEHSDVDLLVEFEPSVADSFANFLDLKEALEQLLGRPVYLVELRAIRNRRLRHHIEQSKSPLYAGEAMNGLYKTAPAIAKKIPHSRDIIGFKNILAHGYAEIDHSKVHDIAVRHAPDLLAAVKEALREFSEPKS